MDSLLIKEFIDGLNFFKRNERKDIEIKFSDLISQEQENLEEEKIEFFEVWDRVVVISNKIHKSIDTIKIKINEKSMNFRIRQFLMHFKCFITSSQFLNLVACLNTVENQLKAIDSLLPITFSRIIIFYFEISNKFYIYVVFYYLDFDYIRDSNTVNNSLTNNSNSLLLKEFIDGLNFFERNERKDIEIKFSDLISQEQENLEEEKIEFFEVWDRVVVISNKIHKSIDTIKIKINEKSMNFRIRQFLMHFKCFITSSQFLNLVACLNTVENQLKAIDSLLPIAFSRIIIFYFEISNKF